ncbi:MAG TPA: hypothetical protein VGY77_08590 [Gemmataceae bacterium]|jgi:hypothetical protein|nr:hypothetical protein [Gemmataceae bacterium]
MNTLNLIHLFDFYLAVIFLISTVLRASQYRAIIGLVRGVPGRWPKLFNLVKQHSTVFLTWTTVLPAILAFTLSAVHMLACRLVWPHAQLTIVEVGMHSFFSAVGGILGVMMLGVDCYATFKVGEIDRQTMEKYLDQAEYWLCSWTGPVVHFFTLGYINPRKMVTVEVQKALIEASKLINNTFWWVSAQTGLRVAFGLTLWLIYARQK